MLFNKPIGGEHWFDTNLFNHELNNYENSDCTFLSGGQSAMNLIIRRLEIKEDETILLPSYLCPTIVQNMDRNRVNYGFYRINPDLSINCEDLHVQIGKHKVRAVFFIDYFGFYHNGKTLDCLNALKDQGIALIEDGAQMLWFERKKFIGDFVFNSYRKFLPIDGSLVLGETAESYESVHDEYYEYMNTARMKITAYVQYGLGTVDEFVGLYAKADEFYGKSTAINGMTEISMRLLNKVDGEYIGRVRRSNYAYLYDRLSIHPQIRPVMDKGLLENNIPIGFPVMIENRDPIRSSLRSQGIYCPVHWPILDEKWVHDYPDSIFLTENLMTLPIDQRYGKDDLDRLIDAILKLV